MNNPALTLLSILTIGISAHSQITITSADMPDANDSIRVSFSTSPIDPTLTGANYTWNFASLNPDAQVVMPIVSPSDFSVPYNFVFNPFNTSYGIKQYTPDSIGGFQPEDAYDYYKENSGDWRKVGMGMTINGVPIPMQYDQPDYVYRFPMNYGNLDSCDAHFEITIPGFGTYAQFIHRVNEVDGWGQLTTPLGTVASLRIKSTLNIRDSIAPEDTSMSGYAFDRPTAFEYKWLSAGSKLPYLQVNATDFGGSPTVTQIIYQDVYQPGTYQFGISPGESDAHLLVYPNPASEFVCIQYSLSQSSDVKVEILDMTGKIVENLLYNDQPAGNSLQTISLKHLLLKPGTYCIRISGNGFSNSQKFIAK